jgi:hypothetical protein
MTVLPVISPSTSLEWQLNNIHSIEEAGADTLAEICSESFDRSLSAGLWQKLFPIELSGFKKRGRHHI